MASRAVSRVFVASGVCDLAKHLQKLLSSSSVTVENLHFNEEASGFSEDELSEAMAKRLHDVEVLLCDRNALLKCLKPGTTPNLRWAQTTSAGVDELMKGLKFKKPEGDLIISRTAGNYGDLMGEYVIGQIIARERGFAGMKLHQDSKTFDQVRFHTFRSLSSLSIGILGFGTIGKRVAEMCKFMGMTVWAVTRTRTTESFAYVDHARDLASVNDVLQNVDYLCCILPDSPTTTDLLSGDILKQCKEKKSVLISIGRGSVISDDSLARAVREGWLGGAVLDVFNEEPLPAASELWTLPNVVITPHVSGPTLPEPVAQAFVKNLKLYTSGLPLLNVVDWGKGY